MLVDYIVDLFYYYIYSLYNGRCLMSHFLCYISQRVSRIFAASLLILSITRECALDSFYESAAIIGFDALDQ